MNTFDKINKVVKSYHDNLWIIFKSLIDEEVLKAKEQKLDALDTYIRVYHAVEEYYGMIRHTFDASDTGCFDYTRDSTYFVSDNFANIVDEYIEPLKTAAIYELNNKVTIIMKSRNLAELMYRLDELREDLKRKEMPIELYEDITFKK